MDFKKVIEEKGLKKTWVANKIGVSRPFLSQCLNGKSKYPKWMQEKLTELLK